MQPEHQHGNEKRIGKKKRGGGAKKARVHCKSDSAEENCLIILLVMCELENNSFPSPRAQLGNRILKESSSFIKASRYVLQYRQTTPG